MTESRSVQQAAPATSTIDEHLVRVISAIAGLIAVATLLTPQHWLLGVLALDFCILGFGSPRFSPLAIVSAVILRMSGLHPKPVYFPPKQFAARVGFVVSALAFGLWLLGLPLASTVFVVFLVVGAAMDSIANYCLACWLYSMLQLLRRGGK